MKKSRKIKSALGVVAAFLVNGSGAMAANAGKPKIESGPGDWAAQPRRGLSRRRLSPDARGRPNVAACVARRLLARCIPLPALAFFACAVFLPQSAWSAESTELAQLLDEARAETEARTLRAPDGIPLCFPPAAMVAGTEAHVIDASRGRGVPGSVETGEMSGYLDVYVEQTGSPVLLILRGSSSIIWRLHLSDDADLKAVHLMASTESFVIGVPDGVPVTARFKYPLADGEKEYCVFAEVGPDGIDYLPPKGMVDESQRFSERYGKRSFAYASGGGPLSTSRMLRRIRRELRDHADIPIVSYPGWSGDRIEASRRAIAYYEAIRQRGRDWLAAHKLPTITPLGPDAEMVGVPEGITNVAAMEWLAECGYAERTSRDIVEYLCGRRLALALLEGEDVFWQMAIQNCSYRQDASRMFTILGPIRVAEENCRGRGHLVALLIPPDVTIDWDHACSWRRIQYPRDD